MAAFRTFVTRRGYRWDRPAPLLSADRRLLFTNASVTPYKPLFLRGTQVPRCANAQPCFRGNPPEDLLYAFTMLGLLAGADRLAELAADIVDLLHELLPGMAGLTALACAQDADLIAAWTAARGGDLRPSAPVSCVTRWRYGEGDRLRGRGLTIFAENGAAARHEGCSIGCPCGRHQFVGVIVVIANAVPPAAYVEAAIGAEGIAAFTAGGDPLALPPYRTVIDAMLAAGADRRRARRVAGQAVGLARLVEAGCAPGPRGPSHVTRRLARGVARTLTEGEPRFTVADLAHWASLDPATVAVLAEESRRAEGAVDAAQRFAERARRRSREITPEDLTSTFGVAKATAQTLLRSPQGR